MKTDLATSIVAAIIGVVAAYFICNLFLPEITEVTFKALQSSNNDYTLVDPNPEVFNYRAIDPVVEVYIGQCTEFDANGNCLDNLRPENSETSETPEAPENPETPETPEAPEDVAPNEENQNGATD